MVGLKGRVCCSENDKVGLKDSLGIYVTKHGLIYLAFLRQGLTIAHSSGAMQPKLALNSWHFPCSHLLSEILGVTMLGLFDFG